MIVGLGLDICDIERMRKNLDRHGPAVMDKVLTEAEKAYCERKRDPAVPFAGRWAAKEAAIKALGAPEGLRYTDMVIEPASDHAPPRLVLSGVGAAHAAKLGVTRTLLTITHDGGVAAAVVILEASEPMAVP